MSRLSKLLCHVLLLPREGWTREDWWRLIMHLPHGIAAGWVMFGFPIPWVNPLNPVMVWVVTSFLFLFIFLAYEVLNDWRKEDYSYKDVYGIASGFVATVIVLGVIWAVMR